MEEEALRVDKAVFEGLEFVRESGLTNLFDRVKVCQLLRQFGYFNAEEWVREDAERYAHAIFVGIEPIDDGFDDDVVVLPDMPMAVKVTINVSGKEKVVNLEGDWKDVEMMLNGMKNTYGSYMTYEVVAPRCQK